MNRTHRVAVLFCAALFLCTQVPGTAQADTSSQLQAQLDQARTDLAELYANAQDVTNQLNKITDDLYFTQQGIDETREQIKSKQSELRVIQGKLGHTMAERYKSGNVSLLSLALASSSIEDFIGRIYYANKVSEAYHRQIQGVRDLQADLEERQSSLEELKASLEQLLADEEERSAQLEAKAGNIESYVAGLSTELQNTLAAEAEARAEEARTQAAAKLEEHGGSVSTGVADAPQSPDAPVALATPASPATSQREPNGMQQPAEKPKEDDKSSEQGQRQDVPTGEPKKEAEKEPEKEPESQVAPQEPEPSRETQQESPDSDEQESPTDDVADKESGGESSASESSSSGLSNMAARTAVVNYVLAQIGKPYVWATHGPDSYDCSGLTGAAYESIGYFVGYSDAYQEQYCNKSASEAVYGDIVWRPGHVGICIGGGVTVEAHNPAVGIGYGSVDNFQRSGSPLG